MRRKDTQINPKAAKNGHKDTVEAAEMPLPAPKLTVRLDSVQLLSLLNDLSRECGTRAELARRLDVSGQFIGDVLAGKKKPGKKLLKAIGARAVTMYELDVEERYALEEAQA